MTDLQNLHLEDKIENVTDPKPSLLNEQSRLVKIGKGLKNLAKKFWFILLN